MNLRFPGQYFDSESGTHYNFFRDYTANKGRYIQADPIGVEGGVNFYAYVKNNSVNNMDPSGLQSVVGITDIYSPQAANGMLQACYQQNCVPTHQPTPPNGCGSEKIHVPDHPLGFDFKPCCDVHDICYDTCQGPGKASCDADFGWCMYKKCWKEIPRGGPQLFFLCSLASDIYWVAVTALPQSQESFDNGRRGCCG